MSIQIALGVGSGAGLLVLGGGLVAIFYWIARNPSNAERIAYWFWSAFRVISAKAEKYRLATDVTHRINSFALKIDENIEGYTPVGLEIRFADADVTPEAFMEQGRLVVRMKPHAARDRNFLTVATLYVSKTLFPRVKLHLRPNQRNAFDLFTTEKLIRSERASLVDEFIGDWVNPALAGKPALAKLIAQFHEVDEAGLFLYILVQELHLLSSRIVGMTNKEALRADVESFVCFLEAIARRPVGDTTIPLTYCGRYLRVGIQIVSKSARREALAGDITPWVRYAVENFTDDKIDHVYFLGNAEEANRSLIEAVADRFCDQAGWDIYTGAQFEARLFTRDGHDRRVANCMVLCRSRAIRRF